MENNHLNTFLCIDDTKDAQDRKDSHLCLSLCYMLAVTARLLP